MGKVYMRNEDGEWIDLGSGHLEINDVEDETVDEDYAALFTKPVETFSMAFTIAQPDPLIRNEAMRRFALGMDLPSAAFALECTYPIKRTFWQWLRRKPRQYGHLYIPHARLEENR